MLLHKTCGRETQRSNEYVSVFAMDGDIEHCFPVRCSGCGKGFLSVYHEDWLGDPDNEFEFQIDFKRDWTFVRFLALMSACPDLVDKYCECEAHKDFDRFLRDNFGAQKDPGLINRALRFAYKIHQVDQFQTRKGKKIPYLIHPLSVGQILERVGASEEVIAAGLLHDTIEDCKPYGSVTKEMLEKEFGANIARMVNDVTEQDKSLSWEERKRLALEHIKNMEKDPLLVKSADVLHNMTDQLADYISEGEEMFKRFNAPKDKQLTRYIVLISEIIRVYPGNPLRQDLTSTLEKMTQLWK